MAVEAVQTNWVSFQLITLFIFLLCVFLPRVLGAASRVCEKSSSLMPLES